MSVRTEAELEAALHEDSLTSSYGDPEVQNGLRWEPQRLIRSFHPGRDGLPTIDDDPDTDPHVFPRTYSAWNPGETFVVSGPCGDYQDTTPGPPNSSDPSSGLSRGRFFKTRRLAQKWALEKYGAILEEYLVKRKWCIRVPVPGGPHDPRVVKS